MFKNFHIKVALTTIKQMKIQTSLFFLSSKEKRESLNEVLLLLLGLGISIRKMFWAVKYFLDQQGMRRHDSHDLLNMTRQMNVTKMCKHCNTNAVDPAHRRIVSENEKNKPKMFFCSFMLL